MGEWGKNGGRTVTGETSCGVMLVIKGLCFVARPEESLLRTAADGFD
jgi:hypothetical protein